MSQNILITGTGRREALGFNLVRRYLEQGNLVFATVRSPSAALSELQGSYPSSLRIVAMDISCTESVKHAKKDILSVTDHLDLIINNAVVCAPDTNADILVQNPDGFAPAMNVGAVGALRVIQIFYPLLQKSKDIALIVNISSESGSIGACYRTNMTDYAVTKASLNMITKTLWNRFKDDDRINILCVHPGWMRTNEGNAQAPLQPYEHAETLRKLFEERRANKNGDLFITYKGEAYPW